MTSFISPSLANRYSKMQNEMMHNRIYWDTIVLLYFGVLSFLRSKSSEDRIKLTLNLSRDSPTVI